MNQKSGIAGWDELDAVLGELREVVAERDRKVAKRDAEVAEVANKHSGRIDELEAEIGAREGRVRTFLEAVKDSFGAPGTKARFKDLVHGRVGARQGSPKLVTLRGLSEDEVVAYMVGDAARKRTLGKFVRTTVALDKKKILAEMDPATMADVGLGRDQEDVLFFDLKEA